ncbi:SDR family oxidoreductase [Streptomyces sp. RB6PN25]|uniref:SDR family oxidoreductase n=1 Tax=Streptomyces humicola TaxID=2953240 RepID=A0ABT1PWF6_9ACTN|nr:SDR family NAD(P)-dependent oxidoreductase [Streptomyces humicola]MCQ4080870.1 SDR family oxidoreductase [Streptomyces humicola]
MHALRCLVIGAASGIGQSTAARLLADGLHVVAADLPSATWDTDKDGCLAIDVGDEDSVRVALERAEALTSGIDAVVNCAGLLGPVQPAAEHSVADFERILRVNLTGAFIVSRAALPPMASRGYGRLVHFASTAGKEGVAGMTAYSASKAGVMGLVKALAKEYADSGVTVNAIAPGKIATPLTAGLPPTEEELARIPLRRYGTPQEAAALVRWIISRESSYTTGSVFDLSGGRASY